jgi:broad specificity phosphatase PhoE
VSPIIHCVRHAQGFHNITLANHHLRDPSLTPLGKQQCRDLAAAFPHRDKVELVVTSPLNRTIQTALLVFGPEVQRGVKVLALPELQEITDLACDTGSELGVIKEQFRELPVDFGFLEDGWHKKVR